MSRCSALVITAYFFTVVEATVYLLAPELLSVAFAMKRRENSPPQRFSVFNAISLDFSTGIV
jgi:hypothetical protein